MRKSLGSMIALAVVRLLTKESEAKAEDYKNWLNYGSGGSSLSGGLAEKPVYCAAYLGGGEQNGAGGGISSGGDLPWLGGNGGMGGGNGLGGTGGGNGISACVATNQDPFGPTESCAADSKWDPDPGHVSSCVATIPNPSPVKSDPNLDPGGKSVSCVAYYTPEQPATGGVGGGLGGLGGWGSNLQLPSTGSGVSACVATSGDPEPSYKACVASSADPVSVSNACVATFGNNGASSMVACADEIPKANAGSFAWDQLGGSVGSGAESSESSGSALEPAPEPGGSGEL